METAFTNLPSDPAALRAIILAQAAELAAREAELRFHGTPMEKLKAQLAAPRRARFGASSEKLERIADQLELSLEEIEASQAQDEDEAQAAGAEAMAGSATAAKRAKPSRQPLPQVWSRTEDEESQPPCSRTQPKSRRRSEW